MVMMMMMMATMVMRMMLVTEWDANGRLSTMDKGCGCVKTCFDDHLTAKLPVHCTAVTLIALTSPCWW